MRRSFLVELVHGDVDTCQAEAFHDFAGGLQTFGHGLPVFVREVSQYIVYLASAWKVVADAEAQAGIVLRAQRGGNVLQSVVAGIASFPFRRRVPKGSDRSSTTISVFSSGMFSFCIQ